MPFSLHRVSLANMHIQHNQPLQSFNTFGIEAAAKHFAAFTSVNELQTLLHAVNEENEQLLVLGGGSNILFTEDFNGWVLKNDLRGIELIREDADHFYVKAMAGENWHNFVMYCIQHGYAGLENLSLIPGNVGASPMQNIGAYGVEIKDVFEQLEAYHIAEGTVQHFSLSDCAFGYRESVFKGKYKGQFVILSVTCKLKKHPVFHTSYGAITQELEKMGVTDLSIQAISNAVINIRKSKLPDSAEIGNAGSFFKNPEVTNERFEILKQEFSAIAGYPLTGNKTKLAAGWLIEQCGWKGYRRGDAGCHAKQALVLVNYGHASGQEILDLSSNIIESVQNKFGVTLEREVNII